MRAERQLCLMRGAKHLLFALRLDHVQIARIALADHQIKICDPAVAFGPPGAVKAVLLQCPALCDTFAVVFQHDLSVEYHQYAVIIRQSGKVGFLRLYGRGTQPPDKIPVNIFLPSRINGKLFGLAARPRADAEIFFLIIICFHRFSPQTACPALAHLLLSMIPF